MTASRRDVFEMACRAFEAEMWPDGPAHGSGSAIWAAHKPRIAALLNLAAALRCPACFDEPHRGRCPVEWCDCFTGPVPGDPTLVEALNGYLSDEGNHVGGVWGDYGQVVVDASDIGAYLTGVEHEWERTSDYAATFNQMREALDACEVAARLHERTEPSPEAGT